MEFNPKSGNNYSKSFASDGDFSRVRRPPQSDFSGRGGGGPPRNRNSGMPRGSGNFGGMPSRGMQQPRQQPYAFRKNPSFNMPPPGGSFAAFTKNFHDYQAPMCDHGDFSLSMGSSGGFKQGGGGAKPLFNYPPPSANKDIKTTMKPIVSPSAAAPIDNTKGGFGRGRRGPPVLGVKLPAGSSSSASNVFSSTVETKLEKSDDTKIVDEETVKPAAVEATDVPQVQDKPSDVVDKTQSDVEKNTPVAVRESSPAAVERFDKAMEISNYKILVTAPNALFDGGIHKKWSEVGLSSDIESHVESLGFSGPRPIQSLVIPICAKGKDVIFQSVMDSGKLTTIVLSIIAGLGDHAVGKSPQKDDDLNEGVIRPRAIIVSPTARSTVSAFERCCRVVGELNFSVASAASLEGGGDCDIFCTNLDELKGTKQGKPRQKLQVAFNKLRVFAVEQTERLEENFLNLVRFVRTTDGIPKDNRQVIVTGTTISTKVKELALFMTKPDYYFVQLKREAPEKPRRYSKSEMVQVRRADTAAAAEKKSDEHVIAAEKKLVERVDVEKKKSAERNVDAEKKKPAERVVAAEKKKSVERVAAAEKKKSVERVIVAAEENKSAERIVDAEQKKSAERIVAAEENKSAERIVDDEQKKSDERVVDAEKPKDVVSLPVETKLEKSDDTKIVVEETVNPAVEEAADGQKEQDKPPSDIVDKTQSDVEKNFASRLETAIGDIFKAISEISKQLKDLSDRIGELEKSRPAAS